jgi:hypothetical protein
VASGGPGGIFADFIAEWREILSSGGKVLNRVLLIVGIGLLIYSLVMGQPILVVLSLAIAWGMRKLADLLDEPLAPFWAARNVIPTPIRMMLAFVVPFPVVGALVVWPPFTLTLDRLPYLRSETWGFVIMTAVSAFVAYLFVREPRPAGSVPQAAQ